MRDRPHSVHARRSFLLLAVFVATACASPGSAPQQTVAEHDGKEAPRSLLEATTPQAAATQSDAGSQSPDDAGDSARPGRLLIYSAITGHVPLKDKGRDPADRYRSPAEREAARARSIEAEIEDELARQEKLKVEETASVPPPGAGSGAASATDDSPLAAPPAPELRELPAGLFKREDVAIPPGTWQNQETLYTVRESLDVDQDGKPEEVRYVDSASGVVIRSEQDLDFDGTLDAWTSYENGKAAIRVLDTNHDGKPDTWERYADGKLAARSADRDADGVRDTFYQYQDGWLKQKSSDENNDGTPDRIEEYADRHRVSSEEDRSHDGHIDTWTRYGVVDGHEVVERIERDTRGSGHADVIETYETSDGETRLARKEEDVNGDGKIDVISTYENGKLVQRAISDEALSPL